MKDKILKSIQKDGLLNFLMLSRMSLTKIFSITGDDLFTRDTMIRFIYDVCNKYDSFGLSEVDMDPIFYNRTYDEYQEITYISKTRVVVDIWGGHEFESNLGEFSIDLHGLSDILLQEVFDATVNYFDIVVQ
jgi:hypothetical protein